MTRPPEVSTYRGLGRRFCEWHINDRGRDYEVIRFENGKVIAVAVAHTRDEAWCAYKLDRAQVLADPMAIESRSLEQRFGG